MSKLKPCPFCGSKAKYASRKNGSPGAWELETSHWIYCTDDYCHCHMGMYEDKEQAVLDWNIRV